MTVSRWGVAFSALFDNLYSERRQKQLDRLVVNLSVAGLIAHLALVFLSRSLASPPALIAAAGKNYLVLRSFDVDWSAAAVHHPVHRETI